MLTFHEYTTEYTEKNLFEDIQKLREMFENKFQSNQKVINNILEQIYEEDGENIELTVALRLEIDRFEVVVELAEGVEGLNWDIQPAPARRLKRIVEFLANNGSPPEQGWNDSCVRRYQEIMKKLERV